MRAFLVVYSAVVAVLMIARWVLDIRNGALRRPDRRPAEIALHLAALLYTVVQSPGYFLARGEFAPVAMFGILLVLTLTAVVTAIAV